MRKRNARFCVLASLALAASMAIAACGDDDDEDGGGGEAASGPAALDISVAETGGRLSLEVAGDMRPGLTEITFNNRGKKKHTAQLIGVRGNHSEAEVKRVYAGASDGKPLPDWFRAAGGVGTTKPGETTTVTQQLTSGTYFAIDDEEDANLDKGGMVQFTIAGGERAGGSLPQGATVKALDYSFEASGLKAGRNTVLLDNAGKEPHHLVAVPINPGKTIEDVKKVIASDQDSSGPPPFDEEAGVNTSVIDGGRSLAAELELKKGKYALLCFIADRAGGPPHVAKGMVTETTVE